MYVIGERSRSFSPVALLLSLAILYPWYVEGLPSNVPIINTFPSIHSMVTILIFVMMYFLMIRPQRKKQAELQQQIGNLRGGDTVVTTGAPRSGSGR